MDRMTVDQLRAAQKGAEDRRRVRGTQPVVVDGTRFASSKEAQRWRDLRLLERSGQITDLQRQVPIPLWGRDDAIRTATGLQMQYVADFTYRDKRLGGALVIEDAKGYPTDVFKIKRAILAAQGVEITET